MPRSYATRLARTTALAVGFTAIAATVAGCGSSSDYMLGTKYACKAYDDIAMNFKLDDAGRAAEYGTLASHTEDPQLAADFQRISAAFARHDEAIDGSDVDQRCSG